MPHALELILTIAASVLASSGFWAFLAARSDRHSAQTQLMLGLAHDRIVHLCMTYLDRGYILKDEYDDLVKYLYKPYSAFGGNGLAEKVFAEVQELPIKRSTPLEVTRDFERTIKAEDYRRENDTQ